MKYCIAVQETLRREIVVEADSLEDALDHVENEYDKQNIILTADDACVEPDYGISTGRRYYLLGKSGKSPRRKKSCRVGA